MHDSQLRAKCGGTSRIFVPISFDPESIRLLLWITSTTSIVDETASCWTLLTDLGRHDFDFNFDMVHTIEAYAFDVNASSTPV